MTGASGWLGQALVRALLADGAGRVRGLVQGAEEAAQLTALGPSVEAVSGDIRDPGATDRLFAGAAGADVVHAASVIHPRTAREFYDVNVGGTDLVLDRARRHGIRRVVYVSSNSPFGFNAGPDDAFDESSPYNPYMGYGRSKMEAEVLVRRAGERGDVETVIVRCPWFYGEHQPERQTQFFVMVGRGRFPLVGNGRNRRSLVYTGNLAAGLVLAQRHEDAAGRAYWIADARPYDMIEILTTVQRAMRDEGLAVKGGYVRVPGVLSRVAEVADGFLQGRGRYAQQAHVLSEMSRTIACRIDGATRELGYRPDVELYEGMRRSVRWCLAQGRVLT